MAEEIICPACDTPNDALAQQCDACGAELDAPSAYEFEDAPENKFALDEVSEEASGEDDFSAGYGFAVEGTEASDEGAGEDDLYEIEYESDGEEDALYELEVDSGDADAGYDYPEDDVVAADGGMTLEAISEVDARGADAENGDDGFGFEPQAEDDALVSAALSEVSEVEEPQAEAALAPELAAILHPARLEREPIIALPTPGNFSEPASLRVFHNGEQLGTLAVDAACTVLGRAVAADDADAYELEPIRDNFPFADELEEEPAFDLHELSEPEDLSEEFGAGEPDEYAPESSVATATPAQGYQDPQDLEEGPVIDLSQYGDASKFALRHGYIFCQNKNYTLCVLSDMGTQLNDEMLELGARRTLTHGDVIIVGGEVALQFRSPAA